MGGMAKSGKVKMDTRVLDDIRKHVPDNRRDALVAVGLDIETTYHRNAPRDTGSMAESIYTQLNDGVYQEGKSTSLAAIESLVEFLNPDAQIVHVPEPHRDDVAHIGPMVAHAIHNEFGTQRMAAIPTLTDAVAYARANIGKRHKAAFIKIATNGHR